MACSNLGNFKKNLTNDIRIFLFKKIDFESACKEIFKEYFESEDYETYKQDAESILENFASNYNVAYGLSTNNLINNGNPSLAEQGFPLGNLVPSIIDNNTEAIKQGIEMLLKLHSGYVVEKE